jgi:hypothetical protein
MALEKTIAGSVKGPVRWTLQVEGLALLLAALFFYRQTELSWTLFAVLFLAPDLSMLFYFGGARMGAVAYNIGHSTIGPILVVSAAAFLHWQGLEAVGLIWFAHIGFDRMLSLGLKYSDGFFHTHLGHLGRLEKAARP